MASQHHSSSDDPNMGEILIAPDLSQISASAKAAKEHRAENRKMREARELMEEDRHQDEARYSSSSSDVEVGEAIAARPVDLSRLSSSARAAKEHRAKNKRLREERELAGSGDGHHQEEVRDSASSQNVEVGEAIAARPADLSRLSSSARAAKEHRAKNKSLREIKEGSEDQV
ncbi:hypothetical protein PRK78_006605 [Emydomyces testavorans]|uniref:Uncharacterized protein n=1 Tax=Emydomyces testavorans TaxID=2070801 RepID=A0AAF0DPI0_9EURO|nr:hypothetical protein PRK78_006605 [Emydomyces testavorans]